MARVRVNLIRRGMNELLHSSGLEEHLLGKAERVVDQAKALAPVDTGAYRASLKARAEDHPSRVVAHAFSDVDYAPAVEAAHRVLGRAIDAARG